MTVHVNAEIIPWKIIKPSVPKKTQLLTVDGHLVQVPNLGL